MGKDKSKCPLCFRDNLEYSGLTAYCCDCHRCISDISEQLYETRRGSIDVSKILLHGNMGDEELTNLLCDYLWCRRYSNRYFTILMEGLGKSSVIDLFYRSVAIVDSGLRLMPYQPAISVFSKLAEEELLKRGLK